MRKIMLAGAAALALSACGGGDSGEANEATAADNMMLDENLLLDSNMAVDPMNMGNGTLDANSQEMMQQDMNTNAPDTNLANGL